MDGWNADPRIDWHYWFNLREMYLWQACALSVGINPEEMTKDHLDYSRGPGGLRFWGESPNAVHAATVAEYKKRIDLLCSNLSDRAQFTAPSVHIYNRLYHGVRLREVAAFLIKIGRAPLPDLLQSTVQGATYPLRKESPLPASGPQEKSAAAPISGEDVAARFKKYKWQWPLRQKAFALLDKDPARKLDSLAAELESEANKMGYRNRSGECLNAATIRRHALLGVHKEHKRRGQS